MDPVSVALPQNLRRFFVATLQLTKIVLTAFYRWCCNPIQVSLHGLGIWSARCPIQHFLWLFIFPAHNHFCLLRIFMYNLRIIQWFICLSQVFTKITGNFCCFWASVSTHFVCFFRGQQKVPAKTWQIVWKWYNTLVKLTSEDRWCQIINQRTPQK